MAATKKPTTVETYRNIMSELKAGRFAPVYLLMGNESYYIDKICDWFTSNLLTEEEKEWLNNYHREVFERLSPFLEGEDLEWLKDACSAL